MHTVVQVLALFFVAASIVFPAELKLVNGTVYKGEIVSDAGEFFALKVGNNRLAINKSLVATIDGKPFRHNGTASQPAVSEPSRPVKSAAPAPVVQRESPKETTHAEAVPKSESGKPWKITLVNGTVFSGKFISENKRILVIESKGSPVSIYRNMVASIDSGKGTATAAQPAQHPEKSAAMQRVPAPSPPAMAAHEPPQSKPVTPAASVSPVTTNSVASAGSVATPATGTVAPVNRVTVATLTDESNQPVKKREAARPAVSPAVRASTVETTVPATPITVLPPPRSKVSFVQMQSSEGEEKQSASSAVVRSAPVAERPDTAASALQVIRAPQPAFVAERRQKNAQEDTTGKNPALFVSGKAASVNQPAASAPMGNNSLAVGEKMVDTVPALSIVKPLAPVKPVPALQAAVQTTMAVAVTPQAPQTPAPLPLARVQQEKPKAKRTDGKIELTLTNGTVFVGTIKSENARSIGFATDGAVVTILKKLIKDIDGSPYAAITDETPASAAAKPSSTQKTALKDTAVRSCKPEVTSFRMLPYTELPKGVTVEILMDSLKFQGDWKVRSRAARMVAAMGPWGVSAIQALVELLDDVETESFILPLVLDSAQALELLPPAPEAARALGQLGTQGGTELLKACKSSNLNVKKNALFGLGNCFYDAATKAVIGACTDPDPAVRCVALGSLRMASSAEQLALACKDADPSVRTAAIILLGKLDPAVALKQLKGMVRDHNSQVRRNLAETIGTIGCPEGAPSLLQLSKDADVFVKASAVHSLGRIKDSTVLDVLMSAGTDQAADVRSSVAQALGYLRNSRSIPTLYALIKDDNPHVREKAEASLKLHTEVPLLIAALDDPSATVRANASYMLWLLTGQEFGDNKKEWDAWVAGQSKAGQSVK